LGLVEEELGGIISSRQDENSNNINISRNGYNFLLIILFINEINLTLRDCK
jgi:hypothetical protein